MKSLVLLAGLAMLALSARAEGELVGADETKSPEGVTASADSLNQPEARRVIGYAFGHPEVLADQRLWGLAHGVRLLTLACAQNGYGAAAEAGIEWQEREAPQIRALNLALGRLYFRRDDVPPDAISAVLGLKAELDLTAEALKPACETLAEALAQPRYDLARRREEMLKP